MTEDEWAGSTDLDWALDQLLRRGTVGPRKLRLFACGAVRRAWAELEDSRSRTAVEVSERFADGEAADAEREAAAQEADIVAVTIQRTARARLAPGELFPPDVSAAQGAAATAHRDAVHAAWVAGRAA